MRVVNTADDEVGEVNLWPLFGGFICHHCNLMTYTSIEGPRQGGNFWVIPYNPPSNPNAALGVLSVLLKNLGKSVG